jgi:outer membrane protein OmpA-like peptidoglycan-associated protein
MTRISRAGFAAASTMAALSLVFTTGCSTKNYVRSQTEPVIQKTNELDDATATNNRTIHDVDTRSQAGIQQAQNSANTAQQNAQSATQAANTAQSSATDAVNRADTLSGVIANLDNYKQVGDVSVTFGFNKDVLTKADKDQLDQFGTQLASTKSYILEVTGGTDSVGSKEYNYDLSDRRAMAVVQYLVGLGKDVEIDSNKTSAGRAKNRHVEVQLLSNTSDNTPPAQGSASATSGSPSGL